MITKIEEPIDVAAIFVKGCLKPFAFSWQGRRYKVSKILGVYSANEGSFKKYFYAVQAGTEDVYEILLDIKNMQWRLIEIHGDD